MIMPIFAHFNAKERTLQRNKLLFKIKKKHLEFSIQLSEGFLQSQLGDRDKLRLKKVLMFVPSAIDCYFLFFETFKS